MAEFYRTGNKSHKKGAGDSSKRGRPKGTTKGRQIRHFTALSAARCVAYARARGCDDKLLARYLIYSFGLGNLPILISQAVMLIANAILWGAYYRFVKGIAYIIKGIATIGEAEIIGETGILFSEIIGLICAEFGFSFPLITKAQFLIGIGAIQSTLAALIIWLDSLADNIVYFHFLDKVLDIKIEKKPFKIIPKPFIGLGDENG